MTPIVTLVSLSTGTALGFYLFGRLTLKRMLSRACPHLVGSSASRTLNLILVPASIGLFLAVAMAGSHRWALDSFYFLVPWAPTVAGLLLLVSLVQLVDMGFSEVLCRRRDVVLPTLVRNILIGSAYFLLAVAAAVRLFRLDVVSFLATSTVASLVLGLALQDTLGNIFAGISLAVEGAFKAGDWVRVNDVVGQVHEVNWRAVQLVTNERVLVSLPNSVVARGAFTNLSRPVPEQCEILRVGAAYGENPTVVIDALLKAAQDVGSVLTEPAPQVFLEEFGESAVIYILRYWVRETGSEREARSELLRNTWFRFKRLGIKIPFPTREFLKVEPATPTHDTVEKALASLQLFTGLSDQQRQRLSLSCSIKSYAPGELVFDQGDAAHTFFVVLDGEVELATKLPDPHPIGGASSGEFFGEMALVQMQTRLLRARAIRPTDLLEITAEAFHELLASSEKMAETISKVMAERLQERHRQAEESGVDSPEPNVDAPGFLGRLRMALGLG